MQVDIWAVGCIFGELLQRKVLFSGTNEIDQVHKIFDIVGTPNDSSWPGYSALPAIRSGMKIKVRALLSINLVVAASKRMNACIHHIENEWLHTMPAYTT
jgi:serine/threonine protein kinase